MQTWTNQSVRLLAGSADPIGVITERARAIVMQAVQDGWKGPPFDPLELASLLNIESIPMEDVREARIVLKGQKFVIEFNPNRPRTRLRFSVAHEIAHTLFPDCTALTRNRGVREDPGGDGWELELLCNLAASEFLIPTGDNFGPDVPATADSLLDLQAKFDVSVEAAAIRLARATHSPFTVVVASRIGDTAEASDYRIDYAVSSRSSSFSVPRGTVLRGDLLSQCTAVGYTAKGTATLAPGLPPVYVECVGIPPYPGMTFPRVICLAKTQALADRATSRLTTVNGDALRPRGPGPSLLAQVVNDATPNWGGGFSLSVKREFPTAQTQFQEWASKGRNLRLGRIHIADVKKGLSIASLIAQKGYGDSPTPRIRYAALKECLDSLAEAALERNAKVHMPRMGSKLAGGNWSLILQLVDDCLIRRGVPVTIYSLPGAPKPSSKVLGGGQLRLDEALPEEDRRNG
jgi:Zn-dependent peptidase ImmA (M78 family)